MLTVAILSGAALAGIVAAKLVYRAGYRAGKRARVEIQAGKLFEAGYHLGYRTHATLAGSHRAAGFPAPLLRALGLGAPTSPIDEAERITREAVDG